MRTIIVKTDDKTKFRGINQVVKLRKQNVTISTTTNYIQKILSRF